MHKLNWHRGLHEDVQSDTRVFSPLAIVVAIEDGQRPVQDVTVSVWTTFENNQTPVFESLLVAETRVVPHRVTDARCHTVRAPYPLAYPPPPSLILFDRLKINRQVAAQTMDIAGKGIDIARKIAYNEYETRVDNGNKANGSTIAGLNLPGAEAAADWWNWLWDSGLPSLLSPFGIGGGQVAPSVPESAVNVLIKRGLQGIGGAMVAAAFKSSRYDLVSSVALATLPFSKLLWEGMPIANLADVGNWQLAMTVGSKALRHYVNSRPNAEEGQTKFTIRELSRTIFSLSVMRSKAGMKSHSAGNEFRRQQSEQFRRELVVWEWLRDIKNKISAPETELLAVSKTFATRLHVRVAVDDALGCDPSEAYHEITCAREDCYELGALAAGTLRDIESLFEAIEALHNALDEGIASETATDTWWDLTSNLIESTRDFVNSKFKAAQEVVNGMSPEKKKQLEQQNPDELAKIEGYNEADKEFKVEIGKNLTEKQEDEKQQAEETETDNAAKEYNDEAAKKEKGEDEAVKKDGSKKSLSDLRANFVKLQTKGIWLSYKRGLHRGGRNGLNDTSLPTQENRRGVLRAVKQGLDDKLARMFLEQGERGYELYQLLLAKANAKNLPAPMRDVCKYVRRLPQRATAYNTKRLFLFRADRSNGFVDISTRFAATRVYSEYYDANQLIAAAMDSSAMALHRLVIEWEANSSTRVKLVCMCKSRHGSNLFKERVAVGTLVLTTPVDVQASSALVELTERERRQIRMVVRRAQQKCDKSVLERLGLQPDDASLLASHVFGDLWADELVALHNLGGNTQQAQMLEQASRRATARLRAAGKLLLDLLTVHNPVGGVMDFDDVPCNATDVSLLATQRGRDAGLIIERLLFGKNYVAIRAAFAPLLRATAQAAGKCADVFERAIPERLPYEPVASLFDRDRSGGVAAYLRVKSMLPLGDIVSVAAAAYPSVLLLGSDPESQTAAVDLANAQGVPEAPTEPNLRFDELVRTMRYRLASLKMDELPVDEDGDIDIDQLAKTLSATSISVATHSFYVPFGFGDSRPPPTFPPLPAPMFGSVPVFGKHLARAFGALQTTGGNATRPYSVTLKPTFGCLEPLPLPRDDDDGGDDETIAEGASVHPNVVQVLATDDGGVEVRYTASRVWGVEAGPNRNTSYGNAKEAAEAHLQGEDATRLSSDVCAIAWNAERVMQAVIAALASASDGPNAHDGLTLRLVLPDKGDEPSVWFTRPNNPMAIAQKRKYSERVLRFARLTLQHGVQAHQRLARKFWKELKERKAMDEVKLEALDKTLNESELNGEKLETVWPKCESRQKAIADLKDNKNAFDAYAQLAETNVPRVGELGDHDAAFAGDLNDAIKTKMKGETNAILTALFTELELAFERVGKDYKAWEREHEATARITPTPKAEDVAPVDNGAGVGGGARVVAPVDNGAGVGGGARVVAPVDDEGGREEEVDDVHATIAHAGLVCALGVGMGMLAPLLGDNVPMQVEKIQHKHDWVKLGGVRKTLETLEAAFDKCAAMRMSEACLVVVGVLSNL